MPEPSDSNGGGESAFHGNFTRKVAPGPGDWLYVNDEPGQSVEHALAPGRHAWLQVIRGAPSLNGETMGPGDGAAISDETRLNIDAGAFGDAVEAILFDLG